MDLNEAKNKLKKTTQQQANTNQSSVQSAADAELEAKAYAKAIADTNVDAWYPYMQNFTMKTFFLPITKETAKIFMKNYLFLEKKGTPLSEDEASKLNSLAADIDAKISEFAVDCDGKRAAFVRCSTRSPKDSSVSLARSRDILTRELDHSKDKVTGEATTNSKLLALLKAALGGMKVYSGKEALTLLCSSERIYEDLAAELEKKEFHQLIIIREWADIPVAHEYRGFVHKKSLNAITQYYHTIYFPDLPGLWDKNITKIREFFTKNLAHIIPLDSYIIDFAILPQKEDKILVIELNPFSIATDSNLFSWKEDMEILKNGPFTSRFTEKEWPTTPGIDMAIKQLMDG